MLVRASLLTQSGVCLPALSIYSLMLPPIDTESEWRLILPVDLPYFSWVTEGNAVRWDILQTISLVVQRGRAPNIVGLG